MKYTAEMWDKMQHIMANYNDHMLHAYIRFGGKVDEPTMRKALAIAVDKVPILKTIFVRGVFHAEWNSIDDFKFEDVYTFLDVEKDAEELSEAFLLQILKESREAQIKVLLLRDEEADTLSMLINHMCFDGADIKEFMYLIARIYTELINGGDGKVHFKNGSRSEAQIFKDFTPGQLQEALHLVSYSKKQKSAIAYPFETRCRKKLAPKIIKYKIDEETFLKLKANAKMLGVTLNDVLVGCFYRATVRIVEMGEDDTLGIPNMVDLRRYIKSGKSEGMCNLTSMVVSNLGRDIGANVFETVAKVKINMDGLKGYYPGLHGLPLLRKVFALTPYSLAHFLIGTFFKNPLIGVSNIGIIDDKRMVYGERKVVDAFITGSVKFPPYMQLALSTYKNIITHTVAVYGTPKDYAMFERMYDYYGQEIKEFANAELTESGIRKLLFLLLMKANAEQ